VLHVDVDFNAVVEWMIERGDLDPTSAIDDPAVVATALSRAIGVWSRR